MALDKEDVSWQFVEAGSTKLHYGEVGTGPPVICLHGTGPGVSGWTNFRANVGALAERHRTIILDLPRFGESEKVTVEGPRLTYLSGVVRDFMDAIGLEKAHLMGNSMGGQAAVKLAVDSPERVDRLVLIGPGIRSFSTMTAMPTETVRMIMTYYRGDGPSREKMRLLLRSLFYHESFVTDELVEQRYQASIRPEVIEVNQGPHWAWEAVDHRLPDVQAPTLIVWGFEDRASPFDHAILMMQQIPDARLLVLPRSGHAVNVEKSEEVNEAVVDFLNR
jgi:pimeloyl-ACP methyl ester carboxylesterase